MKYHLTIAFLFFCCSLFAQEASPQPPPKEGEKGVSPMESPPPTGGGRGEAYAVVVGISDYQDEGIPDLRFADKDAEAFAGFLQSPAGGSLDEDHLKVLINKEATAAQFAIALDWLWEVVKENDRVIIYFSGHGDVERKSITQPGYLLCWDAPAQVYMAGGAFNVRDLNDVVTTLSVQNKAKVVLVTDACRAGKLSGSGIGGAQATAANLAKQYANEIKILSCQPDEYSIEGEQWGGGRGAFSYHLLDGLYGMADGNNDASVNLREIGRYLEDRVSEEVAPQNQNPMTIGGVTEKLTDVFPEILKQLKEGKRRQLQLFTATESRGIEDDVLAAADTNIVEMYFAFQKALKDKQFLEPANASADFYYEKLSQEPQLEKLHSSMRRNYAAALQDDAQQVMNEWMKTSDDQLLEAAAGGGKERLPIKVFTEKVRSFPRLLERAAELLGKGHYMYTVLQARKYFFEGYLLTNADRNPNRELGERALTAFRKALDRQAELPQAYWQMSKVYGYNLLQPDSAEVYAQKAMELNPAWVLPYTDLAFMFSEKYKQFDRAKPWLEQAMQLDSNSTEVRNSWGVYFARKKEYLKAEQQYKKAIQLDSTFASAYYNNLGNVYTDTRRFAEAEQQFKKAIRLDSTFAFAYNNLGEIYRETRRYDEAEEQYKKSIRLDSTFAFAYNNLGNVYADTRRYDEAEQQYKKAIRLDSTYAFAYNNLGLVYYNTRRYDEAEQQYKKSIRLDSINSHNDPNFCSPCAYNNLGNVYANTRRYDEAEEQYKKAIRLDSTYANTYINLGIVYHYARRYAEEEQQYQKGIRLDSTNAFAYANLACLRSQQNQTEAAFGSLEKALKNGFNYYDYLQQDSTLAPLREQKERWEALMQNAIVPDTTDAGAWNRLGQVYIQASNYAPAEAAMHKAVALDAMSAPYRSNLGYIYLNLGRYAEAEAAFEKAIALDSAFANAHKHLGTVCFKTNRPEEAKQHFQKALELNPNYTGAKLGLAYVLTIEGKTAEAIGYVEQAIGNGSTFEQLEADEDLAPLREQAAWKELLQKHFPAEEKN